VGLSVRTSANDVRDVLQILGVVVAGKEHAAPLENPEILGVVVVGNEHAVEKSEQDLALTQVLELERCNLALCALGVPVCAVCF